LQPPQTRYARSGDVRIAYQVVGNGPIDLVFVPGFISNLDIHWEDPGYAHLLRRLGAFSRLILFDKRGTGLSDRVDTHHLPNLETRMDDVRAVMDAVGSQRAVLLGASEGGPMSILFAATYPKRTRALVLYGSYAHFFSWVLTPAKLEVFIERAEETWGSGQALAAFAPGMLARPHFCDWWARYERVGASPAAAVALSRMNAEIDVRPLLSAVRVPTLVLHRRDDVRVNAGGGQYLARHIAGAKYAELPGSDHLMWVGDVDRVVDEIEEFLTGARPRSDHDRVLATVVVAEIVEAARGAARHGDRRWVELVRDYRAAAGSAIERFRGRPIGERPDGTMACFDGPARALRCAGALREAAERLGLRLRCGVHTGELEMREDDIGGLALHVAVQIAASARPGQIVASAIVGAARGFLREAVALAAWVIALFLAWHFSDLIAPHLGGLMSDSDVRPWAARVIIVLLVLLLGAGVGAALGHFVRLSIFSGMDRLLGFAFGVLRGFVLLGVFVILGQLLRLQDENWWRHSMLIPYGQSIANGLRMLVGEERIRQAGDLRVRV